MDGQASPEPMQAAREPLAELATILHSHTNTHSPVMPSSYLSPVASPDEYLIQQRGRKHLPGDWSTDILEIKRVSLRAEMRTPIKDMATHSAPRPPSSRKRLPFGRPESIPLTPDKIDFSDIKTPEKFKKCCNDIISSPPIKKICLEDIFEKEVPVYTHLKALNPSQLIEIIKQLSSKHPEIEEDIKKMMPSPDLALLDEKLSHLKSNIYASLPQTPLNTKISSRFYSRAVIQLKAFTKCLVDQGNLLADSQHWQSVSEYALLAWKHVKECPVWDNETHNYYRKHCFTALSKMLELALKKGSFDLVMLRDVRNKLQIILGDCNNIQSCLEIIDCNFHDNQ